jgi:hypothetical protein
MSPHSPFTTFGSHTPPTPSSDGGECFFRFSFSLFGLFSFSRSGGLGFLCALGMSLLASWSILLVLYRFLHCSCGPSSVSEHVLPMQLAGLCGRSSWPLDVKRSPFISYRIEERGTFSRYRYRLSVISYFGAGSTEHVMTIAQCHSLVVSVWGTEIVFSALFWFWCGVNAQGYAILHYWTSWAPFGCNVLLPNTRLTFSFAGICARHRMKCGS